MNYSLSLLVFIFTSLFLQITVFSQVSRKLKIETEDDRQLQQQVHIPVKRINLAHFKTIKDSNADQVFKEEDEVKIINERGDGRGDQSSLSGQSGQSVVPFNRGVQSPFGGSASSTDCAKVCVDDRYLKHYSAKRCTPVMSQSCQCPVRFDCPQHFGSQNNSTVCWYSSRSYRIGMKIPVKNECRMCFCRDSNYGRRPAKAEIDCSTSIECPEEAFGVRPPSGCYSVYEHGKCCSQRHECPPKDITSKRELKTCNYGGKEYMKGQKIYPEEDDCKICICGDDWVDTNGQNPLESRACRTMDCDMELEKELTMGCIPIYHEKTCCPIEYKCPQSNVIRLDAYPGDKDLSQSCLFEGRVYPIGAQLKSENVCVDCTCRIPPDFTCIHKSCPGPPSENCHVDKWDDKVCCQKYDCKKVTDRFTGPRYRSSYNG